MVPVSLPIEGMSAWQRLDADAWCIEVDGTRHTLRHWRWGERRRLVAASATGRRLDEGRFAAGLASLYDPAPPPDLVPLFATAALLLFGVEDGPAPAPLGEAERALADRYGWTPGALEAEPASALDALLAARAEASVPAGWQRIRFEESGE